MTQSFKVANESKISVLRWDSREFPLLYMVDSGPSNVPGLTNPTAVVTECFRLWTEAGLQNETSSVQAQFIKNSDDDISIKNIYPKGQSGPYLSPNDGYIEVVFDPDGQIMKYFGVDPSTSYGMSYINYRPENGIIYDGFIIFSGSKSPSELILKGTIMREIGHLLGIGPSPLTLDHAGNNPALVPVMTGVFAANAEIYAGLKADDNAALASLYPGRRFEYAFGAVTGRVMPEGGGGIMGAHVVLRNVADQSLVSFLSGYKTGAPNDGVYDITGVPAGKYQLFIEPVTPLLTGITLSSIGGIFTSGRTDFEVEYYNDEESFPDTPHLVPPGAKIITVEKRNRLSQVDVVTDLGNPAGAPVSLSGSAPQLPVIEVSGGSGESSDESSAASPSAETGGSVGSSSQSGESQLSGKNSETGGSATSDLAANEFRGDFNTNIVDPTSGIKGSGSFQINANGQIINYAQTTGAMAYYGKYELDGVLKDVLFLSIDNSSEGKNDGLVIVVDRGILQKGVVISLNDEHGRAFAYLDNFADSAKTPTLVSVDGAITFSNITPYVVKGTFEGAFDEYSSGSGSSSELGTSAHSGNSGEPTGGSSANSSSTGSETGATSASSHQSAISSARSDHSTAESTPGTLETIETAKTVETGSPAESDTAGSIAVSSMSSAISAPSQLSSSTSAATSGLESLSSADTTPLETSDKSSDDSGGGNRPPVNTDDGGGCGGCVATPNDNSTHWASFPFLCLLGLAILRRMIKHQRRA
jgi:hypothetical protein